MERLNEQLYKLFIEEISNLELGHTVDRSRLCKMKRICQILLYIRYTNLSSSELIQITNLLTDIKISGQLPEFLPDNTNVSGNDEVTEVDVIHRDDFEDIFSQEEFNKIFG